MSVGNSNENLPGTDRDGARDDEDEGEDETDAVSAAVDTPAMDPDQPLYVNSDPTDLDSEVPRAYLRPPPGPRSVPTSATSSEGVSDLFGALRRMLGDLTQADGDVAQATDHVPADGSRLAARRVELRARTRRALKIRADGQEKSAARPVLDLPLSAIAGGRVENIRLAEDEVAFRGLCESLETEGQLQPIVVVADQRRPGRFSPVAGFRRLRAAAHLGWITIKAVVLPEESTDEELFFANAAENAQRFNLSDFEKAFRAKFMSDRFGTSLAEYARRLGLSETRVQNLVRYLETLPPDILEAWRAGDVLLNHHMLQKLASMPHDEASEFWSSWRAARATAPAGRLNRARPRRSENRPTGTMLSRLWVAVKRSNVLDEAARDVALKIVDFCLGHAVGVPGLFDPRAPGPMRVGRRVLKAKRVDNADRKSVELPLPDLRGEFSLADPQD